ncbi:related to PET191 - involved in assembly of cytochrome oxidase [Melanopsichium pennsylvanicum]|uniref:Related to PET191 - involved in assembly of cytochrome oxidase n=1 Tax=Melanopsichium pennsylvanicum TaxID=63383 RepID=A0AAJ5C3U5_9BASI|nr:related to PET191 - involved in assembly of cytochrome oxidase [Melanopsichium pennsylvanicum]
MISQCLHIRDDLTACVLKTDCYLKDGKSAQECITSHMAELPMECQHLYKSFVECRRGMFDMRKRFRGNAPPVASGNNAPGGTSTVETGAGDKA